MTNNSPLDEHIKQKFGDYTPDVPAHVWDNIMAERDKRRPAGFWFSFLNKNVLLLLLVLAGAGAGIVIYKNTGSSKGNNTAVTSAGKPVNENTGSTAINSSSTSNTNKQTNDLSTPTGSTSINNVENVSSTVVSTGKQNNDGPGNSVTVNANDKTTISNGNKNGLAITTTGNKPANNKKHPAASINDDHTISSSSAGNKTSRKTKQLKGSAAMTYTSPAVTIDDTAPQAEEAGQAEEVLLLQRMQLNLDLIRFEKDFNLSVNKINNPNLQIPCPEAEKNAAGNKRYFEIYGGPDYAFRSMTDTGNSAYLQKRKESMRFTSAFSAGFRYTRVFSNGMSFRTGINYSQINEKFKFTQGNIIQVVYVTDSNGDTTGSYTTTSTRYKTTHNKFRTIDIPIMVGYELGNGRIHANFNAGAIVNLYSWQKGDVLDTAYQPVSITTGKSTSPYQYKTNVGIGFIGAVSVYYKMNDRWHIFAEPYFRYNFSSVNKSVLTLKQKYNTAGIRLGVRFDF